MKKTILAGITLAAFTASAFVLATAWKVNDKNSTVKWECGDKKGSFGNLSAGINFDKKNLADSKITATIDVKTLKAGNEKLEAHLLSPDFFEAEKFPRITFTSTEIKASDVGYIARGTLNMKDSTKVIELPFTFKEDGATNATFSGTMTVYAGDYGVIKKVKQQGADKVTILLEVPVSR